VQENKKQKRVLICGAGGFIGHHMVKRYKKEGWWVRGIDLKYPEFEETEADHFVIGDLRDVGFVKEILGYAGCVRSPHQIFNMSFDQNFDEIIQLAADMGGAGYIFTGEHDADVMHNSATINLNILHELTKRKNYKSVKIFFSSSACIYPEYNQLDPDNPKCSEDSAYPAAPDSLYGWEKLFSERLYFAYARNYSIPVYVARFHNIYGPLGTWQGGKEKAPAAICRKVAQATDHIEIWGDGKQTRSFLYIDDCIDAVRNFMSQDDFHGPVNIGSEEMVTINQLVEIVKEISTKTHLEIKHIDGPTGVRGRNSDNVLIWEKLHWNPVYELREGLKKTYEWIEDRVYEKT
jgi:nucleoside-diphosphate-sugar epimerase